MEELAQAAFSSPRISRSKSSSNSAVLSPPSISKSAGIGGEGFGSFFSLGGGRVSGIGGDASSPTALSVSLLGSSAVGCAGGGEATWAAPFPDLSRFEDGGGGGGGIPYREILLLELEGTDGRTDIRLAGGGGGGGPADEDGLVVGLP